MTTPVPPPRLLQSGHLRQAPVDDLHFAEGPEHDVLSVGMAVPYPTLPIEAAWSAWN
jgi:hypothetical protein